MPDFAYIARDNTGKKVSGTLTAPNRREVLATLGKQALFPVEVTDAKHAPVVRTNKGRKVKATLMAVTYAQLADLLRSGVPLYSDAYHISGRAARAYALWLPPVAPASYNPAPR